MIAAGKEDLRRWFLKGVQKGHKYMLVVCDRMEFLDDPDTAYYADSAEHVWERYGEFNENSIYNVMEIYDLTADMEEQLAEMRAWRLPELP